MEHVFYFMWIYLGAVFGLHLGGLILHDSGILEFHMDFVSAFHAHTGDLNTHMK